jgi:uncharacterized protein
MMRILVLLAIGLLLYIIIGNLLRKSRKVPSTSTSSERMVRCEHCGLHIVEKEALQDNRQYFCSTDHLEAHRQSR